MTAPREIRGRIRLHRAGGAKDSTGQEFIEFVGFMGLVGFVGFIGLTALLVTELENDSRLRSFYLKPHLLLQLRDSLLQRAIPASLESLRFSRLGLALLAELCGRR